MNADGTYVIVGGIEDNSGICAVWIFTRSGTTWTQQGAKLVGSGDVEPIIRQGLSVLIDSDGTYVVVGRPDDYSTIGAPWIFIRSGTTWTQ